MTRSQKNKNLGTGILNSLNQERILRIKLSFKYFCTDNVLIERDRNRLGLRRLRGLINRQILRNSTKKSSHVTDVSSIINSGYRIQ